MTACLVRFAQLQACLSANMTLLRLRDCYAVRKTVNFHLDFSSWRLSRVGLQLELLQVFDSVIDSC